MTGPMEIELDGRILAIESQKQFGDWAESQVLLALQSQYPQYLWQNLNVEHNNAPFDIVGCWPDTGEVVWLVEVKGTDFTGSSPGITMRKDAKRRKLLYVRDGSGQPVMACYDWQTGQIVARTGLACFSISEMLPLAEALPDRYREGRQELAQCCQCEYRPCGYLQGLECAGFRPKGVSQ